MNDSQNINVEPDQIDEKTKRKLIRAFFFPIAPPSDSWGLLVLFMGIIASMVGFLVLTGGTRDSNTLGGILLAGGIIVTIIGGFIMWGDSNHVDVQLYESLLEKWQLTDKDLQNIPEWVPSKIEGWLNEDVARVNELALQKLNLQAEDVQKRLVLKSPLYWFMPSIPKHEILYKKIEKRYVFSCYRVDVVVLSEERVANYSAYYNFLRDVFLNERIVEFLYRDIIAITTSETSTNYDLPNGNKLTQQKVFRAVVASGDAIEVLVDTSEIRDLYKNIELDDHDKIVHSLREMLRSRASQEIIHQ